MCNVDGILSEIIKNNKKLESCSNHEFSIDVTPAGKLTNRKWQCAECGGEVSSTAKMWYELGQKHKK